MIECIMEERNEDEYIDQQLRVVLEKLHEEKDFIKKLSNSDEVLPIDTESITLITETIKEENEMENEIL
jgi:PDZ domain-containing secreted protein